MDLVNSYKVPDLLHYLEDFVTAGPPYSPQCAQNLSISLISSLQASGLTSSSWQVRGAYSFTNHAGQLLAFLLTNYKFFGMSFVHDCPANSALGARVSDWPFASRSQSWVAWPNLFALYDRPPMWLLD